MAVIAVSQFVCDSHSIIETARKIDEISALFSAVYGLAERTADLSLFGEQVKALLLKFSLGKFSEFLIKVVKSVKHGVFSLFKCVIYRCVVYRRKNIVEIKSVLIPKDFRLFAEISAENGKRLLNCG